MFTQSCFIRKNTPEIRKKLEELGYENKIIMGNPILYAGKGVIYSTDIYYPSFKLMLREQVIDCSDNEELFFALAALRDDSDIEQIFKDGDMYVKCPIDSFEDYVRLSSDFNIAIGIFHKATAEELINHFK